MKVRPSSPKQRSGPFPEFGSVHRLLVGWPENEGAWGVHLEAAQADIISFVQAALGQGCTLTLCCHRAESVDVIRSHFSMAVEIWRLPMGDIWLRDTGPVFTQGLAHIFRFNGWGGKFLMPGDCETSAAICDKLGLIHQTHNWVLEGGAIDSDGDGSLLTTRECLLNVNRGPERSPASIEQALKCDLNVDQIVWLERGMVGDHTDGHVDNIARFVAPRHVVCQTASGIDDPNTEIFADIVNVLRASGLRVSTLPSPGLYLGDNDVILPASHLNFVILPCAVLFPIYEAVYAKVAKAVLTDLFPGRTIIPISARGLLQGGGAFHCASLHVPSFNEK